MVTVFLSSETAGGAGPNRYCATTQLPFPAEPQILCVTLEVLQEADAKLPSDNAEIMKKTPVKHKHKRATVS